MIGLTAPDLKFDDFMIRQPSTTSLLLGGHATAIQDEASGVVVIDDVDVDSINHDLDAASEYAPSSEDMGEARDAADHDPTDVLTDDDKATIVSTVSNMEWINDQIAEAEAFAEALVMAETSCRQDERYV